MEDLLLPDDLPNLSGDRPDSRKSDHDASRPDSRKKKEAMDPWGLRADLHMQTATRPDSRQQQPDVGQQGLEGTQPSMHEGSTSQPCSPQYSRRRRHRTNEPDGPSIQSSVGGKTNDKSKRAQSKHGTLGSSSWQAGQQLRRGSRDDSFLPTIAESRSRENSNSTGAGSVSVCSEVTVDVCSEASSVMSDVGVLSDFSQIFSTDTEEMKKLLRQYGFDKPLELQRRVVPLIMSAFSSDQKSFVIIQGKPRSGKTSSLVLGTLGAINAERQGLRTIILSSSTSGDFKKYFDICSIMHPLQIEYFEGLPHAGTPPMESNPPPLPQSPKRPLGALADPISPKACRFRPVFESPGMGSNLVAAQDDMKKFANLLNGTSGQEENPFGIPAAGVCEHCRGRTNRWRCPQCCPQQAPAAIFGHPSRILPLLREAPALGLDLSNVEVLALDDTEEMIQAGLIDEVCEVCMILKHFSKQRLRHVILSHFLSREARSMLGCLRNSLLQQQNLFGLRAHQMQAKARSVKSYCVIAPRTRWAPMLAALHKTLALPSGIIFDDAAPGARSDIANQLRLQGLTVTLWQGLRDTAFPTPEKGAHSFFLTPSDPVVLKIDLPKVRCVLHFDLAQRDLSIYGMRLMCLEQVDKIKGSHKKESSSSKQRSGYDGGVSPKQPSSSSKSKHSGSRCVSVLFSENAELIGDIERAYGIELQVIPTEILP